VFLFFLHLLLLYLILHVLHSSVNAKEENRNKWTRAFSMLTVGRQPRDHRK
jgi:hypothetical protein